MKTDTLKKMLLMLLCVVSVNMTALGKELVSDVLPIADPYILFYNDTYYAYGTSRADGFEVYSSKDMKSWERSPRLALNKEDSYGDKWFWAPEVYYVEEDKKFYMFYSANDFRSQDYAVGYATSDSPFGPWRKSEKNPLLHKVEELVGTGHGAPFLDRSGGYRYIFHAHKSRTEVNQRNSYIIDMSLAGKERVSIGGGLIRPEVVK